MKKSRGLLMALLLMPSGPATRVIDRENDDPSHIAPYERVEMNLSQIDSRSQRSVSQVAFPWSDVTWKANKGFITERYLDRNFEEKKAWRERSRYLNQYSAAWVLSLEPSLRDQWIAALSPAEKYDLLLGIVDNGLTKNIVKFLDTTLGDDNAFPGWWGLCEGSAASTMFYSEPVRPVSLYSEAYGIYIPFYAPDIKGLATLLWSRFNTKVYLPEAGLQCKKDGKGCFDSNPASFHAVVHHFLDLSPGILVGDMDPSPVVWNFPIVGYSENYFRPDLGQKKKSARFETSIIKRSDWPDDPRAKMRSPGTVYVAGVAMTLSYAVNRSEMPPVEGSLKRKINSRDLIYELELDSNFNLIGGEWLEGKHPDLLWSIPRGTLPESDGDPYLPPGGGENGVIPRWWDSAARYSAEKLTPLRRVVDILIQFSAVP